ncbi:protein S100-A1 isoform X1 [Puntigrus tetrazona]|uniref:protein S100-A1 isoform X1 n=2 Tax=Puntigrus tetrazona TaxID=1606681 RepID=UPI001C8A17F3|nr:protein S100-A1 isoform X1 [Puntigrus tetrazona]
MHFHKTLIYWMQIMHFKMNLSMHGFSGVHVISKMYLFFRVYIKDKKQTNMVSKLEDAMEGLIKVFHTYSSKEGDKYKLSKAELKSLLQGELSDFLAASKDPMVVEKIMSDLDENRDGEVDFQEFVVLVAALTVACNEFFVESMKN